jgi:hypothetical protein
MLPMHRKNTPCGCLYARHHPDGLACRQRGALLVCFDGTQVAMCRPCAALAFVSVDVCDALAQAAAASVAAPAGLATRS